MDALEVKSLRTLEILKNKVSLAKEYLQKAQVLFIKGSFNMED